MRGVSTHQVIPPAPTDHLSCLSVQEAELPLAEPEEPAASPTKLVQYGDYRGGFDRPSVRAG